MIHGMCAGAWCWEGYKAFFEKKGYLCRTPTLRHHGVNPADPPPINLGSTSVKDYVEDLEDAIRSMDETPIIMGHSMGGLLAQKLAEKGLAKCLVLLAPAPPSGINVLKWSVLRSFCGLFRQWGFWSRPFRLSFNAAVYAPMQRLSCDEQKAFYDKLVCESGRVVSEIGLWFLDPTGASRVDETKVTCPVLIMVGSKDRMTPASVVKKIFKKYRQVATYQEFDHHGHWIIGEQGWRNTAGFICDWLQKTASASTDRPRF
jgi:pimeloyl-ACP methyl ester carboxylesterase